MVLPTTEVIIKEEKEDFEIDAFSESDYDVKVKVEQVSSPIDWCVQHNELIIEKCEEYSDRYSDVVDYEELTSYDLQICHICKQMFQDSYSLLCHNVSHLEVQLVPITIQCDQHQEYLEEKPNLKTHVEQDCQNIETYSPSVDNEDSKKSKLLYRCKICSKKFSYKVWFDHQRQVHSDQNLQCDLCKMKFKCKRYLRRHIIQVHQKDIKQNIKAKKEEQQLQCSQCPAVFNHKTNLHLHVKNCHCEKVQCEKCFSVLKKSNLPNHMRRVHYNDGKEHKCECGKSFRSPRYLNIHIRNTHNLHPIKKKHNQHGAAMV